MCVAVEDVVDFQCIHSAMKAALVAMKNGKGLSVEREAQGSG